MALAAVVVAAVAAVSWLMVPVLPRGSGPDLNLFPMVAAQFNLFLAGTLPANAGSALMLCTLAVIVLAAGLVARIALLRVPGEGVRYLGAALALGTTSVAWFWFLRDAAQPIPLAPMARIGVDALAMVAYLLAHVALVACFRDYPEPLTHDFVVGVITSRWSGRDRLAKQIRSGGGLWRLWSWLPPERYGRFGRRQDALMSGTRRLLRSRELVWAMCALCVAILGPILTQWPADLAARWLFWVSLAYIVLFLDPLFRARSEELALLRHVRRGPYLLAGAEHAVHRFLGSVVGLTFTVSLGIGLTAMWSSRDSDWFALAAMFLVCWSLGFFGHALGLMYLNWKHGTSTHRRAIEWIFLGSGISLLIWWSAMVLALVAWLAHWFAGGEAYNLGKLLGLLFLSGPALVMLCFTLSLWLSILHRGTFDPGLALRRGTGIAILGLVVSALFVACEGALSSQVVTRFGMPDETGGLLAGVLTALAFVPLRGFVDRRVDRAVKRLLPPEAVIGSERKELVIVFADLSGYTRLSEIDEPEALMIASVLHQCAHRAASRHAGIVVKTLGDAVLLRFDDPRCALDAIGRLHVEYTSELSRRDLELLPLHTGVSHGDVVVAHDGDVYGAQVNLAARLQSLAGPGEVVVVSRLRNVLESCGTAYEVLPQQRFKNIKEPLDCLRFRPSLALT
jgi:class 3 adenylate cyclase